MSSCYKYEAAVLRAEGAHQHPAQQECSSNSTRGAVKRASDSVSSCNSDEPKALHAVVHGATRGGF